MKRKITLVLAALLFAPALMADTVRDAICNGDTEKAKRLLSNANAVNQQYAGEYPLTLALYCYGGQPALANYLLDRGAKVDLFNKKDYSNLFWGIRSIRKHEASDGMRQVVFRMVRMGADVRHAHPDTRQSALTQAAGAGDEELVNLLISKGADKNARVAGGWCVSGDYNLKCNAADFARLGGNVELALKLEGKDPAPYRKTLSYAVKKGDTAQVQKLIQSGADLNLQEPISKFTALYYAVIHDRPEILKLLLAARADPNLTTFAGTTPLREAVVKYNEAAAKILIDGGAKADHEQTQGCGGGLSEFGWAIAYGQFPLARYMIERGAVVPANPGNAFRSMYGRFEEEVPLVELFLSKGARPVEGDIEQLNKIAGANAWIKEKGINARIIALLQKALDSAPEVANPTESEEDIPLPPDLEEMSAMRSRSMPAGFRTRSMTNDPRARSFEQQFMTEKGVLRASIGRVKF